MGNTVVSREVTVWNEELIRPIRETYTSPQSMRSGTTASLTRTFLVKWEERFEFVRQMLGGSSWDPDSQTVTYYVSQKHPERQELCALETNLVEQIGTPLAPGTDENPGVLGAFEYAAMEVRYGVAPYQVEPDSTKLWSVNLRASPMFVTLPYHPYKFASDNLPHAEMVSYRVKTLGIKVSSYHVPQLDIATVTALAGCVNSTWFLGFAPGTVLFEDAETSYDATAFSVGTTGPTQVRINDYQYTYTFTWREKLWNMAPRPDTGAWDTLAPTIYQSADLNNLP